MNINKNKLYRLTSTLILFEKFVNCSISFTLIICSSFFLKLSLKFFKYSAKYGVVLYSGLVSLLLVVISLIFKYASYSSKS